MYEGAFAFCSSRYAVRVFPTECFHACTITFMHAQYSESSNIQCIAFRAYVATCAFTGLRHVAHALLLGVDQKQASSQPLRVSSSQAGDGAAYDTGAVQLAAGMSLCP